MLFSIFLFFFYLQFLKNGSRLFDIAALLLDVGQGLCKPSALNLYVDLSRAQVVFNEQTGSEYINQTVCHSHFLVFFQTFPAVTVRSVSMSLSLMVRSVIVSTYL